MTFVNQDLVTVMEGIAMVMATVRGISTEDTMAVRKRKMVMTIIRNRFA